MPSSSNHLAKQFATTHWSVVLAAGRESTSRAEQALAELCKAYWYPLYAFVRRQGYQAADAQDLIQEFFARLLQRGDLESADPLRGRFRSFLLIILKRFLSTEAEKARAKKRGGDKNILSLDFDDGESRYRLEPAHNNTAESNFERQWALTVLDNVLARVADEYRQAGKEAVYEGLKVHLTASPSAPHYAETGEELSMTAGAIKVAVHRMRKRYRELLKNEVRDTVDSAEDVADELAHLFEAVRNNPPTCG